MRKKSLLAFATLALVVLAAPLRSQAQGSDITPRHLVSRLDYVAKDYGGAVKAGKVVDANEYKEQVDFCADAVAINSKLTETQGAPQIASKLAALQQLINDKADAGLVATQARALQAEVVQLTKLEVAPTRWPSLAEGHRLYLQRCASCHGESGHGDGVSSAQMTPRPANFFDAERMSATTPFQEFNTIRLGIPGTGMAAMPDLDDQQVWNLAFFVIARRHSDHKAPAGAADPLGNSWKAETLKIVATSGDVALTERVGGSRDALATLRLHSEEVRGSDTLAEAHTKLRQLLDSYHQGDFAGAKAQAVDAYIGGFEPLEPRLKLLNSGLVSAVEDRMADLRVAIDAHKPEAEVRLAVERIEERLVDAERLLAGGSSPGFTFISVAGMVFREGFEAVLVILMLLGILRKTGATQAARWVHGGWVGAVGLGVVAWFVVGWLLVISDLGREKMEGAISLIAVVVLLFVGFWLHSQTEMGRWRAFLDERVKSAVTARNFWGLASISFFAVFREALETVVFLQPMGLHGGRSVKLAILGGFVTSLLLIIFLAWACLKFGMSRIPIRRLFLVSAAIMGLLAVVLAGKGVHAFQEIGFRMTPSPIYLRWNFFGIYPTVETLGAQALVLVLSLTLWRYGQRKPTPTPTPAPAKSYGGSAGQPGHA